MTTTTGRTVGGWVLATLLAAVATANGQENAAPHTVRGTVRAYLTAPRGEVHGLVLGDDTEVRFPKHLGDRVTAVVARGDRVRVTGAAKAAPGGGTAFQAYSITNLDSGRSVEVEGPEVTKRGVVRRFTTAPKGEADGLVLGDGTVVRFPKHLGGRVKALVDRGDRVRVSGRSTTGPEGDARFRASAITNIATGQAVDIEDAPPPPKGKGARYGKDKGPKEEDPKDADPKDPDPIDGALEDKGPKDEGPKGKGPKGKAKGKGKKGRKRKGPKEGGPKDDVEGKGGPKGGPDKELLRAPRVDGEPADRLEGRIRSLEAEIRRLRRELEQLRGKK